MKISNLVFLVSSMSIMVTTPAQEFSYDKDPFRQLGTRLPSPSEARLASGAPGPAYWQQRADYNIDIALDEAQHVWSRSLPEALG